MKMSFHSSSSAEVTMLKRNTTLHPRQAHHLCEKVVQHEKKSSVLILQHNLRHNLSKVCFVLLFFRKKMSSAVSSKVLMLNNSGPVKKEEKRSIIREAITQKSFHKIGLYLRLTTTKKKKQLIGI